MCISDLKLWINTSIRDSRNREELQELFVSEEKVDFHIWFLFEAEVTATQFMLSYQREVCSLSTLGRHFCFSLSPKAM